MSASGSRPARHPDPQSAADPDDGRHAGGPRASATSGRRRLRRSREVPRPAHGSDDHRARRRALCHRPSSSCARAARGGRRQRVRHHGRRPQPPGRGPFLEHDGLQGLDPPLRRQGPPASLRRPARRPWRASWTIPIGRSPASFATTAASPRIRRRFAEFLWADFFRPRIKAKTIKTDFQTAIGEALKLAKTGDADYLPGWCGPHGYAQPSTSKARAKDARPESGGTGKKAKKAKAA